MSDPDGPSKAERPGGARRQNNGHKGYLDHVKLVMVETDFLAVSPPGATCWRCAAPSAADPPVNGWHPQQQTELQRLWEANSWIQSQPAGHDVVVVTAQIKPYNYTQSRAVNLPATGERAKPAIHPPVNVCQCAKELS